MAENRPPQLNRWSFRCLLLGLAAGALALLSVGDWYVPEASDTAFWNALIAFTVLGVASDSSFLPLPRITSVRIGSSIVFIPFLASVQLFAHPWPIIVAGVTGVISQVVIRRKEFLRASFNTAQYMLGVGLGTIAYTSLGGYVGFDRVGVNVPAFAALVVVFFAVNQATVSFAVSLTSDISPREVWSRIAAGSLLYDLVSSSLAIVLVFLFVRFQIVGLAVLVLPLFFVRHMYQMNLQVERVNRELLELMVKAIEARDPYTSGHSVRVAEYARSMARELGLPPKHVDDVATAALLHDVGKIYEEFAPLLRKEGRLTPEERMLMQAHPVRSAELAGTIAEFRGRVQADIKHHHENFDGTGYPEGLAKDSIPIGARIIMVADTIDAMTTDRPYRNALTLQKALEELGRYAGQQFDPTLVELVSNSPSIRRLLGPQLASPGELVIPSMQARTRAARSNVRSGT
jgi:putative nucleotidyltransferase with HDIG domain